MNDLNDKNSNFQNHSRLKSTNKNKNLQPALGVFGNYFDILYLLRFRRRKYDLTLDLCDKMLEVNPRD